MPPFVAEMWTWARLTGLHFLLMFWWLWLGAVVVTALGEALWAEGRRRRLLERPDDGWRTVWRAFQLGVLSPPSRTRIFRQAEDLLALGVSREGVLAYLVTAQSLLAWLLFLIVALNGPQPVLGQFVAVAVLLIGLVRGARTLPEGLWEEGRERAKDRLGERAKLEEPPVSRPGPVWRRLAGSVAGQVASLTGPLLYGLVGVGFFLALGQSEAYLSLQGSKGPVIQVGNAVVGLLVAFVTAAPLVGNALFAAGLWKPEFVTYAGLEAFYLGTLVMPFVLPRYRALFGAELGRRIVGRLVVGIFVGALAATAWWFGLDAVAGATGVRDAIETFLGSTLRPNDVPWFHHWFAPGI
ncbi:MAG: hypothetical protein ACREMD_02850 [Gemmatimonadota bacterium]